MWKVYVLPAETLATAFCLNWVYSIDYCPSFAEELLKKILTEVERTSKQFEKITKLEKQFQDFQDSEGVVGGEARTKKKPSRAVRVHSLLYLNIWLYSNLCLQDTVRKVYKTLCEDDENFGWEPL